MIHDYHLTSRVLYYRLKLFLGLFGDISMLGALDILILIIHVLRLSQHSHLVSVALSIDSTLLVEKRSLLSRKSGRHLLWIVAHVLRDYSFTSYLSVWVYGHILVNRRYLRVIIRPPLASRYNVVITGTNHHRSLGEILIVVTFLMIYFRERLLLGVARLAHDFRLSVWQIEALNWSLREMLLIHVTLRWMARVSWSRRKQASLLESHAVGIKLLLVSRSVAQTLEQRLVAITDRSFMS